MPRNDNTPLVPLTVTSLEEVEVTLSNTLSAKIVDSDRPGYIAVEVTSKVTAQVSYEDTDSTDSADAGDYESDTYREERTRRKNFTYIVYIPVGTAQAACNAVYSKCVKPTVNLPAPLGLDKMMVPPALLGWDKAKPGADFTGALMHQYGTPGGWINAEFARQMSAAGGLI